MTPLKKVKKKRNLQDPKNSGFGHLFLSIFQFLEKMFKFLLKITFAR